MALLGYADGIERQKLLERAHGGEPTGDDEGGKPPIRPAMTSGMRHTQRQSGRESEAASLVLKMLHFG